VAASDEIFQEGDLPSVLVFPALLPFAKTGYPKAPITRLRPRFPSPVPRLLLARWPFDIPPRFQIFTTRTSRRLSADLRPPRPCLLACCSCPLFGLTRSVLESISLPTHCAVLPLFKYVSVFPALFSHATIASLFLATQLQRSSQLSFVSVRIRRTFFNLRAPPVLFSRTIKATSSSWADLGISGSCPLQEILRSVSAYRTGLILPLFSSRTFTTFAPRSSAAAISPAPDFPLSKGHDVRR